MLSIYLLVFNFHSEEQGSFSSSKISSENDAPNSLELGLSQWKVQQLTALGIGATDIRSLILKVCWFPLFFPYFPFYLVHQRYSYSFYLGWWDAYFGETSGIGKKLSMDYLNHGFIVIMMHFSIGCS